MGLDPGLGQMRTFLHNITLPINTVVGPCTGITSLFWEVVGALCTLISDF